jgi:hypothetical protein
VHRDVAPAQLHVSALPGRRGLAAVNNKYTADVLCMVHPLHQCRVVRAHTGVTQSSFVSFRGIMP